MNCLQYDGDLLVVVEKRHYFGTLVHSSQKYINSQIFFLEHTVLQDKICHKIQFFMILIILDNS